MSSAARHRPHVTVYTRRGCGLCATAEALVTDECSGAEVTVIDVDTDDDLQRRYHVRVPVIEIDGIEIAETIVAPGTVRREVRRARRAHRRGAGR